MAVPMTRVEVDAAMAALSKKIENYAELAVQKGIAVQQGQEVVVNGPVEAASFVRQVVRKAYESGAGHVTVIWTDDEVARLEAHGFRRFSLGPRILRTDTATIALLARLMPTS